PLCPRRTGKPSSCERSSACLSWEGRRGVRHHRARLADEVPKGRTIVAEVHYSLPSGFSIIRLIDYADAGLGSALAGGAAGGAGAAGAGGAVLRGRRAARRSR